MIWTKKRGAPSAPMQARLLQYNIHAYVWKPILMLYVGTFCSYKRNGPKASDCGEKRMECIMIMISAKTLLWFSYVIV